MDREVVWHRMQPLQHKSSAMRGAGAEILTPSFDAYSQRSPRRTKPSPRNHNDKALIEEASPVLPNLGLYMQAGNGQKDSPRSARLDSVAHADQFRSGAVGLEVKVKEVVQKKVGRSLDSRFPAASHVHRICECLYEATLIQSPLQNSLKILYPEVLRAIYQITTKSIPDLDSLSLCTPFCSQAEFLESDRKEILDQIAKLKQQLEVVGRDMAARAKEAETKASQLDKSILTRDREIVQMKDELELAKQKLIELEEECERYRVLYRNVLDQYDEDLSGSLRQEAEKYEQRIHAICIERDSALHKMQSIREDMDTLKTEMQRMVPIQNVEEVKRTLMIARFEMHVLREQIDALKNVQAALKKRAIEEITAREKRLEDSKLVYLLEIGKRTPRPDWVSIFPDEDEKLFRLDLNLRSESSTFGKIMLIRQQMIHMWEDLTQYKTICGLQIEREKETDESSLDKFFTGLGTSPDVPKYLRAAGKIKNRRMTKRDTEGLIKDVWKERMASIKTSSSKHKSKLSEYLYNYLQTHYGLHNVVVEWGYNIVDALERYSYDGDCALFLKTLNGEISEDAYEDQMAMLDNLRNAFVKADALLNIKETGRIPRKEIFSVLQRMFNHKTPDRMMALRGCILHEQPGVQIQYHRLFDEDREGNQGPFVETLRDQYLEEILEFSRDIEAQIDCIPDPINATVVDILEMMSKIDPHKPPSEVYAWLSNIFGASGTIESTMRIDIERLRKTFRGFLFKRTSFPKSYHQPIRLNATTVAHEDMEQKLDEDSSEVEQDSDSANPQEEQHPTVIPDENQNESEANAEPNPSSIDEAEPVDLEAIFDELIYGSTDPTKPTLQEKPK